MTKKLERPQPSKGPLPPDLKIADLAKPSQEIMQHFGADAPDNLNTYCCCLEDALIEQVRGKANAIEEIKRLQALLEEHNIPYKSKNK